LKTDMKIVIRREAPAGASAAGPTESTVPSAGETIVSGPPTGVRSGSRKNEMRKTVGAASTSVQTGCPVTAAATVRRKGGMMNFHPSLASGNFSG
jgi:hypothetical protein